MNYKEAIQYVDSFINFEKIPQYSYASSFNLDRMRNFLKELDNPQEHLKAIHIAGSKGKGSTCIIVASILKTAGYKVGLYTSPHLLDIRERIRVLGIRDKGPAYPAYLQAGGKGRQGTRFFGGLIEEKEFIRLTEKIRPVAERFRKHEKLGNLSFFEFLTAIAFLYFKEQEVDYVVLETGLGGRLDATNIIKPLVCGITNISLEHTDKLGNTLEAIAKEKAGIIKEQILTISSSQKEEIVEVIKHVCEEKKSRLFIINKDIKYSIRESNDSGQIFDIENSYKDLNLNLLGRHQVENVALAIEIVKSIMPEIDEQNIRDALRCITWPARLQILSRDPYIILDGAQNVKSMRLLLDSIKEIFNYERLILVLGILKDKDVKGIVSELNKSVDIAILTKPDTPRAVGPIELRKDFYRPEAIINDNVKEALNTAKQRASKKDLILITGSLYTTAEALNQLILHLR